MSTLAALKRLLVNASLCAHEMLVQRASGTNVVSVVMQVLRNQFIATTESLNSVSFLHTCNH